MSACFNFKSNKISRIHRTYFDKLNMTAHNIPIAIGTEPVEDFAKAAIK